MPRKTYTVDFPDGHTQTFDGPVGMGRADVIQRAKQERGVAGGEIATSFAGGATRHLLEKESGTVNALLGGAATATGVGAPLVAAIPFATRGLKHLSQLIATGRAGGTPESGADPRKMMFPTAPAPTGSDLALDAVEGAAGGYGGQALGMAARGVGRAKGAVQAASSGLPPWMKALTSLSAKGLLVDAATSKPVLGAAEALGEGLRPGNVRSAFGNVFEGMTPGVAPAARPSAGFLKASAPLSPSMRKLQDATKARPPVSAATGTAADVAAPVAGVWPSYLDDISRQADEVRTPRPARTSSGFEAEPTAADYPEWGSNAFRQADAPRPPAARTGTGSPSDPVSGYPSWSDFRRTAPATESAVGSVADDAVSAVDDLAPAVAEAAEPVAQAGRTRAQLAEFTPEARAARAAGSRRAIDRATAAAPEADMALASTADDVAPNGNRWVEDLYGPGRGGYADPQTLAIRADTAARVARNAAINVTPAAPLDDLFERFADLPSMRPLKRATLP